MEVDKIIKSRHTTYHFSMNGKIIDDGIIWQLLENANWAPTHKHTEPWRFKVFTGAGLKRLVDKMIELYKKDTPPEKFNEKKLARMQSYPEKVSHIIAIIMHRDEKESIPEIEEIASVSCAVQNMWLSLDAYGITGYWSTGGGTYGVEMPKFLGLGESEKLLGFFYLGYSDIEVPRRRRKPIEDKVEWVRE